MLGAEDPIAGSDHALSELDRLTGAPCRVVRESDNHAGAQRLGVFVAEDPLAVSEHALPELDRVAFSLSTVRPLRRSALVL
jgi:hypothetical protein